MSLSETVMSIVEVLLDDALPKTLDYQIPDSWIGRLVPGMRVQVPVRHMLRNGTVLAVKKESNFKQLKAIHAVLSEKVYLPSDLYSLAIWMSQYYCTPLSLVIKTMLPSIVRGKGKSKEVWWVKPAVSTPQLAAKCQELRLRSPLQAQVLDCLLKCPKGIALAELLETAQVSRSPVESLVKKKLLHCDKAQLYRSPLVGEEYFPTKRKTLNPEQKDALEKIESSLREERFETRLIHGVTGSGKTEVYLQAIECALDLHRGTLLLIPEIALTSQMVERLKGRFQEKISVLHSRLSQGERYDAWHQIQEGKIPIVIGARSAVFSPIPRLGLIIVDEEHESSYKQSESSPTYQARDVAVMRGKIAQATVLLGSATPSMESYHNVTSGKYAYSSLKQRADHAQLPVVKVIDMRDVCAKAKRFTLFSDPLLAAIKHRVEVGEQVVLFLNRRGYHTSLFCMKCSEAVQCAQCDVNLTFHLHENLLACHLCDYRLFPPPKTCPQCEAEGMMKFKGVGTEMVERSLHAILPGIRSLRLDADTTRSKGSHEQLLRQFRSGKADVLIGTQMIAKGLHFPLVTLVGILNADSALQLPDFRASEVTFQLLTQVAGRSGRGELEGEVIIQTHLPDHSVIKFAKAQDYEGFFSEEIEVRRHFLYPPFSHLIKFKVSGKKKEEALSTAMKIRGTLQKVLSSDYELLPVIPSGHAKLKGEYQYQFLIKTAQLSQLLKFLKSHPIDTGGMKLLIDVDPTTTYF